MLVVTGGISCGKSVFKSVCNSYGIRVIDADDWFHGGYKRTNDYAKAVAGFGGQPLDICAFRHEHWAEFEKQVARDFCMSVSDDYDVVIIPEYFRHFSEYRHLLAPHKVLTIERHNNLAFALERDTMRLPKLTERIYANQSSSSARVEKSDYVLYNAGYFEVFKREIEKWLELHLPEVLTLRTKGIGTL